MVETTKFMFAKKEPSYGFTPILTNFGVITRNFKSKPLAVDVIDRNIDRAVRGAAKVGISNARQTVSYELEITGSGAAGTAPAWMEHLEGCGMAAPVLVAATSATQSFAAIGTALSSLSIVHYQGNQKSAGVGARGTFSFDFTAGSYPFFALDLTALLAATPFADESPTLPNLARWKDPVEVNTANTDFLLDGFAAVLKQFTGQIDATIATRNLVGGNYIQRGNHKITGKVVCEAPLIATKNYFATLRVGTEVTLQIVHGIVAGNIVQFDMSTVQITDIELSDEDGVLMLSMTYQANAGSAPDDLIITAK